MSAEETYTELVRQVLYMNCHLPPGYLAGARPANTRRDDPELVVTHHPKNPRSKVPDYSDVRDYVPHCSVSLDQLVAMMISCAWEDYARRI